MKRPIFVSILMTVLSATLINGNSVDASENKFFCGSWDGVPTTLAKTNSGDIPVIRWVSDHFSGSGFDPQRRCEIVSEKFQEYHEAGTLQYLTTGRKNGQNIVCVAQEDKGGCSGQLFTLKPGSNPGRTLTRLLDVRHRISAPLNESTARVYINMGDFLSDAEKSEYGDSMADTSVTGESAESTGTEENLW